MVYKTEAKLLDNLLNMLYTTPERGAVAQMGERINRTDEVRGSSPLSSTLWRNSATTGNRRPAANSQLQKVSSYTGFEQE